MFNGLCRSEMGVGHCAVVCLLFPGGTGTMCNEPWGIGSCVMVLWHRISVG